jgi:protocatechuate 3,4-dioxygenase beta subunit
VTLWTTGGVEVASVATDGLGFYSFAGFAAGSYVVSVEPQSFWGPTFDVDGIGTPNVSSVSVLPGQNLGSVDFGYLYVAPPGSIGDRVWHDLDGDGFQGVGEPGLGGVVVELRDDTLTLLASVTTDAGGNYGFTTVEAGTYTVSIIAPPFYVATGDRDSLATPNSAVIVLGFGDEIDDADFGLLYSPPPGMVGDRVWDDLNNDGVQDSGEPGLSGLTVTLLDGAGTVVATTTTDSNGEYTFGSLGEGAFTVKVAPPMYYIPTYDLDGIETTNTVDLDLEIGETNLLVDFGLICAPPLGGLGNRVWLDENNDGVQDVGEVGLTNVVVTLKDSAGVVLGTTTTDAAGEYRFGGLSAQTYRVEVTISTNAIPTYDLDGVGTANLAVVELGIGEERIDVNFGYRFPVSPVYAKIGDRVWVDLDENGQYDTGEPGVTNAVVTLRDGVGAVVQTVTVGADGHYLFTELMGDTYTVTVTPPANFVPTSDLDGVLTPNLVELLLVAGEDRLDVDFGYRFVAPDPMSAIVGDRVWADVNGNGIAELSEPGLTNLVVELRGGLGVLLSTTTTGTNGSYLFTGLAAGTYTVRVLPPAGFTPTSDADGISTANVAEVTLVAGEERLDVDFGYMPPAPVSIGDRVWIDVNSNGIQNSNEVGLTNVLVVLRNGAGVPILTNRTGINGHYLFTNLVAGTYTVAVTPPANYGPTFDADGVNTPNQATVTLVHGEQRLNVDFGYVFCPGTGRIGDLVWIDSNADGCRNSSESGLPCATVRLFNSSGALVSTAVTGSSGYYQFTGLFAGTYRVVVTPPACYTPTYDLDGLLSPKETTVTIANGQTRNDVDFGYMRYTPKRTSGTGCTPGFWSNKNGQGLLRPLDFAMLNSLRLVNDNGSNRDFTSSLSGNKSALRSWLLGSSAVNMSRQLSIHLACFQLNVLHGFYTPNRVIATPGIGSGSMTAQQLITAANNALVLDGHTPTGDPNRALQEQLKNALDAANNACRR